MNSMSTAIICYTSPITTMEFIEFEIKKGIVRCTIIDKEFIKQFEKNNLIKSIILRIFSTPKIEGKDICNSLIPFRLIKYITSYHLDLFIRSAIDNACRDFGDFEKNTLTTSCVNSCYSLTLLFSGKKEADVMMSCLCQSVHASLSITMSSGNKFHYEVSNLFSGPVINKINKNPAFHTLNGKEQDKKMGEYAKQHVNKFFQYLQPIINASVSRTSTDPKENDKVTVANFISASKQIDYQFNKAVIDLMRNEIEENCKKINKNKSNIYCVAILEEYKEQRLFNHTFILEQFFCEKNNSIQYKLYQSWIGQATVYDEICKRLYGDSGENSWDSTELDRFLDAFEALICTGKSTYQKCFGYDEMESPLLHFNGQVFTGVNVRYYSIEVNPGKCVENLVDFIQSVPQLQSRIAEAFA